MNLFKRAYYSVINNLPKTIVLFLIVFILGNVMCGALAISQSISNAQNEFRQHYGAKVEIKLKEPTTFIMMTNEMSSTSNQNIREYLEKLVINNTDIIAYEDTNYALKGFKSKELVFAEDGLYYIPDTVDIHLVGVTNPMTGLMKNYKVELKDGRLFSEEEMSNQNRVILVPETYKIKEDGEYKDIQVGDKLTFDRHITDINSSNHVLYTEEVEFEVIGIIKRVDNVMIDPNGTGDSYGNHMAQIYIPATALLNEEKIFASLNVKYSKDNKNTNNKALLTNLYLQLNEADDIDKIDTIFKVLKEEREALYNSLYYTSTTDIYKKISAPIESMSGIANFLLIMSSCLCIMILSVAIFIIIRNRKHEIGILISLGEHKRNVILQVLLEVILVGFLALSSSLVTGNKLGQLYSNTLINDQIEMSRDDLTINESELQEELLEIYSFDLRAEYILSVLTIGSTILLLSVVIPIGYIVKLKPRKILL